jgi:hypothetical protein
MLWTIKCAKLNLIEAAFGGQGCVRSFAEGAQV